MDRKQMTKLMQIVDTQHLTSAAEQIETRGFVTDSKPEAVAYPGSREEVEKIVLFARQNALPLVPVGGGSSIGQVLTPFQAGLGLSLARMIRILEFEPENLTVQAEAGVTNRQLQELLGPHNLFLPAYADYPESTIGGEVAANTGTRKRYRYGSVRDYVLGVEFISPQGRLVKTGGKTVKNASGYDLTKLLSGSWGTMGIITAVTLKLKPAPEAELVLLLDCTSLAWALEAAQTITTEKLAVVALELMYRSGFNRSQLPAAGERAALLIALEGSTEVVEAHGKRLQQLFAGRAIRKYEQREAIGRMWDSFHDARRQLRSGCYGAIAVDQREVDKIAGLLSQLEQIGAAIDLDAGAGVLEFSLGEPHGERADQLARFWNEWKGKTGADWKTSFDPFGSNLLAERISASIDPGRIMFPANAILRGVSRG